MEEHGCIKKHNKAGQSRRRGGEIAGRKNEAVSANRAAQSIRNRPAREQKEREKSIRETEQAPRREKKQSPSSNIREIRITEGETYSRGHASA